ncbi:MAG: hypothetical protein EB072_14500 [Betaproteobacteria bacterium]|nr:hypothetical protein [Betaproteobacteria bacterium]
MKRRLGAVAIILVALTAFAGVLSYVFLSKKDSQNSTAFQPAKTGDSPSSLSSTETIKPDPTEPIPMPNSPPHVVNAPRLDQPANLKPKPPYRSPDWKLLDWSIKPHPKKPNIQLRAASFLASGKYPFVRVEEEIEVSSAGQSKVLQTVEMVGDQIIVKLTAGTSTADIQILAARLGGQAAAKPFAPLTWIIAIPRRLEAVPEALAASTNSGIQIDYAEPNHLVRPMRTPNDPYVTNFSQWHLYNKDQIDKDIKAAKAWDYRTSASYGTTNKVIVAVMDTGVRYTHEDLAANMWVNTAELNGSANFDDDGNGYKDDIYGIDTYSNDSDPMGTYFHGTHCAGLIGAVGNNGVGVTGVAWRGVQIMALKFFGPNGESPASITDITECIDYAIAKGARVINASYGGSAFNNSENSAIQRASNANIIFVAAAGNDGTDNDQFPFYPASYGRSNIIAVGATDRNDSRASFSNFGAKSVDLMAPGVEMWSTSISGTSDSFYGYSQGTSFAAPVVSGSVALLIAESPNDPISTLRSKILAAVDVLPSLSGLCVTGGRLNLSKLLPAADTNSLPLANVSHRPEVFDAAINTTM